MCSNKQRSGKSNIGGAQHQPQPIQIGCPGIKSQGPGGPHHFSPEAHKVLGMMGPTRPKPKLHGSCRGVGRVSAKPEHEERKKDRSWTPPRVPLRLPLGTLLVSPPHLHAWVPPSARAPFEHLLYV